MRNRRLMLSTILILLISPPAHSVDLVLDTAVLGKAAETALNSAKQALNQVKSYVLQLKQYEDMVRNTLAPVAWVWNETTQTYQMFRSYADMLMFYSQGGGLESYLSTYQSAGYYAGSPCFTARGCTAEEIQQIRSRAQKASQAQKLANDAQIRGVSLGQRQLQQDAESLAAIQRSAQTAQGRNEMLGAANQLSAANANNLMAIRALMLQQQEAENAREAALANEQAIQHAADTAMLEGEFVKSPVLDYRKYAKN
jgi:type IV secretion system protein TrbJ